MDYDEFISMRRVVSEILKECNITEFPVDFNIIKKKYRGLFETRTFAEYIRNYYYNTGIRLTYPELYAMVGSEDGFTFREGLKYLIFINEKKMASRRNFTLGHELGHIFLGHLDDRDSSIMLKSDSYEDSSEYAELEKLADAFASDLLCPIDVAFKKFKEKGIHLTEQSGVLYFDGKDLPRNVLMNTFGLSKSAAECRLTRMANYQLKCEEW